MEGDHHVVVVLGAVGHDGAVVGGRMGKGRGLDGAGVREFVGMRVEDVAVETMGNGRIVIFREQLLHERIRVFFQIVERRTFGAGSHEQRERCGGENEIEVFQSFFG